MERRNFLQVVGISLIAAGIPMGAEERVWITLKRFGEDVTERLPAVFRWDAVMSVVFTGRTLVFDGSSVYLDKDASVPFSEKTFEPIRMREGDTVNLSWIIRKDAIKV